jgi:hypothetical protein
LREKTRTIQHSQLGVADLKYDFLIVWRAPRATQSKNHIWIKQRPREVQYFV